MTVEELETIRKIITDEIQNLEKRMEKSMDSRFQNLEAKIDASNKHTNEMIKSLVPGETCFVNRATITKEIANLDKKITTMETTQKVTRNLSYWMLGLFGPIAIAGIISLMKMYFGG